MDLIYQSILHCLLLAAIAALFILFQGQLFNSKSKLQANVCPIHLHTFDFDTTIQASEYHLPQPSGSGWVSLPARHLPLPSRAAGQLVHSLRGKRVCN